MVPVYVIGSVKAPGAVPVARATTAARAVVMAGGAVEDVADLKNAYVLRGSERIPVNLDAVMRVGKSEVDVVLQAQDAVVIPKREDRYQIVGEVARPGPYTLLQGDSVIAAIAAAGGPLPTADLGACTLLRKGQPLAVDLEAMLMDRNYDSNMTLEGGDTLVVPLRKTRVFVFGSVGRPGAYPFGKDEGYLDLIAKAGGMSAGARVDRIWIVRARSPESPAPARVAPGANRAEPTTTSPPAQPRAVAKPSLEERFENSWKDALAARVSRPGAKRAPAPPPSPKPPKEWYWISELTKLDSNTPEGRPKDGDLIYIAGPKAQKTDLTQWLMSFGLGLLGGRW
jgi:protein involved in polysaccharide export with SLBB domain